MRHAPVRLAEAIDWAWIDAELAARFSGEGRPGTETRFMIGMLLLQVLQESLRVAHDTGALKTADLARTTLDTAPGLDLAS